MRKRFGQVFANDGIDFSVRKGEIHALLGENGAGKTTLMNILCGLYRADSGEIRLNGRAVQIHSPRDAINHGVGMVHQQFMLIRPFTVTENMVFGMSSSTGPIIDLKPIEKRIRYLSSCYKLSMDPRARVDTLSVGAQQRVEIIKALYRGAELLILDEPTAVLTPQEANELFQILRDLKNQAHTVIFISHKLDEVMAIADRITVLRDGRRIATVKRDETNKTELAHMMVGREVLFRLAKEPPQLREVVLEVERVSLFAEDGRQTLKDISFSLRAGEILGVAGVDGNGQTELAQVLIGTRHPDEGKIRLDGKDVTNLTLRERLELGFGYIPEDRLADGLIPSFSVSENVILDTHSQAPYAKGWYLNRAVVKANTQRLINEFDVKTHGLNESAGKLSGGNLQKLVLAREVDRDPRVLIAAQPTRGLDVGATEYVRTRLLEQRDKGRAVLLISADLDEIETLSDRILVIYEGQITGLITAGSVPTEALGLMMAGTKRSDLPVDGEPDHG